MKTEIDIRKFLEMLEEKQKSYKPYEIGKKKGMDFNGEILALKWVLDLDVENMEGVPL
jgi:hypothetical protein